MLMKRLAFTTFHSLTYGSISYRFVVRFFVNDPLKLFDGQGIKKSTFVLITRNFLILRSAIRSEGQSQPPIKCTLTWKAIYSFFNFLYGGGYPVTDEDQRNVQVYGHLLTVPAHR